MQTFLTSNDPDPVIAFVETARHLDYRRLGKQRVEALQILNTLQGKSSGWANHPAVKMWREHVPLLERYMNAMILEWQLRGYNNTMKLRDLKGKPAPSKPEWMTTDLVLSHRSNLLRKEPHYYRILWPNVPDNIPYVWPV
jgi:hypothetical protein